jgi:hypothetical protein
VDSNWPMMVTIPAHCSSGSDTGTSSTRFATPSSVRHDSRDFGGTDFLKSLSGASHRKAIIGLDKKMQGRILEAITALASEPALPRTEKHRGVVMFGYEQYAPRSQITVGTQAQGDESLVTSLRTASATMSCLQLQSSCGSSSVAFPRKFAFARREARRRLGDIVFRTSQVLQEGEQPVIWTEAARPALMSGHFRESLFLHGERGIEVDLGGLDMLVTKPERNSRLIDPLLQ